MWLRLALPIAVFVAIAALLFAGLGRDPSIVPSPLIDKPAPEFELPRLTDLDRTIGSEDLEGRLYLLNVWASWCPPCRQEHPTITRIAESGLVPVYGLNWKDNRDDALRWLNQFGDPYAATGFDPDNRVGIDFGVYGPPETFLVDAEGRIRYKHIGPINDEILEREIRPLVQRLREQGQ